jgi:hypothetical protein
VRIGLKIAFEGEFCVPRLSPQNAMRFSCYLLRLTALFLYRIVVMQQPAEVRALNSFKVQVVIANFQFDYTAQFQFFMFNMFVIFFT